MTVDVTHLFEAKNRPTNITLNYIAPPLILRSLSFPSLLSPIRVVFIVALVAAITVPVAVITIFVLPPAVVVGKSVLLAVGTFGADRNVQHWTEP